MALVCTRARDASSRDHAKPELVTSEVRLKLFKGAVHVNGYRSPYSLYSPELVSFEKQGLDQSDATGFIKLNAFTFAFAAGGSRGGSCDAFPR